MPAVVVGSGASLGISGNKIRTGELDDSGTELTPVAIGARATVGTPCFTPPSIKMRSKVWLRIVVTELDPAVRANLVRCTIAAPGLKGEFAFTSRAPRLHFCLTSKMSHAHSRRDSCKETFLSPLLHFQLT